MTYAEQPHQLGLAIPLRSIASQLCGALGARSELKEGDSNGSNK